MRQIQAKAGAENENGGAEQSDDGISDSDPLIPSLRSGGGTAGRHSAREARNGATVGMVDPELDMDNLCGNSSNEWQTMGNHLTGGGGTIGTQPNRRISHSVHCQAMSWGRMVRWQHNERVGDVVTLLGQFAVVGRLAGTVFDGQDVRTAWDVDNSASFALLRQPSDEVSETLDEVWLYNSSDQPLFMCVSRNVARAAAPPSDSALVPNIRRLSPGYCVRVHRICAPPAAVGSAADHAPPPLPSVASPFHRHQFVGNDLTLFSSLGHTAVGAEVIPSMTTTQNATALSLLTISVGIGWGANYECRRVTDLPCRYEVIFT